MAKSNQESYKIKDLREKKPADLKDLLLDLKREQINRRFEATMGQLDNPARSRTIRRAIARIKTLTAVQSPLNNEKAPAKKAAAKK